MKINFFSDVINRVCKVKFWEYVMLEVVTELQLQKHFSFELEHQGVEHLMLRIKSFFKDKTRKE